MAALVAGWPDTVCGTTVDRQCGSSMQTNFNAAAAIWSGQLDVVVSSGVEMMSRVPMGSNGGDLSDKLLERWQIVPQGISAEVIADGVGDLARGAGRVLARVAPARGRGDRRGPLRQRADPDRPDEPARRGRVRRRRDAAARHLRRAARGAAARVRPGGPRHRRQLEPDRRRRRRGADRERARRDAARARAARPLRLVRARRRRPVPDAAREPAGVRERARARRARRGTTSA